MAALVSFLVALLASRPLLGMVVPTDGTYRCQRSSPSLNDCVRQGLDRVIRHFRNGDPRLGLPPLEPIEVPFLEVHHDDGNLTLDLTMKNINIQGFTGIKLAKVTTMLEDVNKLEVTGKTPALSISGEYVSEGLIVTFPLHSAGHFSINMTEVSSSWVVYLREMSANGTTFLQVDGFDIDMMPINISFRPAEQLDGDNNLGEAVNVILNHNALEMYSKMKGKMAEVLSSVLTEFANLVLSQVPESAYLRP